MAELRVEDLQSTFEEEPKFPLPEEEDDGLNRMKWTCKGCPLADHCSPYAWKKCWAGPSYISEAKVRAGVFEHLMKSGKHELPLEEAAWYALNTELTVVVEEQETLLDRQQQRKDERDWVAKEEARKAKEAQKRADYAEQWGDWDSWDEETGSWQWPADEALQEEAAPAADEAELADSSAAAAAPAATAKASPLKRGKGPLPPGKGKGKHKKGAMTGGYKGGGGGGGRGSASSSSSNQQFVGMKRAAEETSDQIYAHKNANLV